jgi:hypothetical protein
MGVLLTHSRTVSGWLRAAGGELRLLELFLYGALPDTRPGGLPAAGYSSFSESAALVPGGAIQSGIDFFVKPI